MKTFSVKEVAERYGVSPSTVSAWIAKGEMRAVNVSRSFASRKPRYRITDAALSEFDCFRAAVPVAVPERKGWKQDDNIINFY